MITAIKSPIKIITTKQKNLLMDKRIILNKSINILASNVIYSPVNKNSYIGIDIPEVPLITERGKEDYIVTFDDYNDLLSLKTYMQHPYTLSKVKVKDIAYYIEKSKSNLMIIKHCKGSESIYSCDSRTYAAYTVSHMDINNNSFIPISSIDFQFASSAITNSL